jgi:nucleoside-diphosphate-sugar epimerase
MKKILLTGPTGSVGFQTLLKLLSSKDEFEITVLELKNRYTIKKLKPFKKNLRVIWGDITDKTDTERAVAGNDIIIHTAAMIPPEADEHIEQAEKVNVGGTMNLIKAINESDPESFMIYTSSISVYGDRVKDPEILMTDKISPSPGDYYAQTKIQAENLIKQELKNFTIFRLSAVMDPKMKLDPLFFHMPLNTSLEIVTSADVGTALVNACRKPEVLNERTFNLGGGKACRIVYEDFLTETFNIFGLRKAKFPPYAFAEKNFHCGFYKDSSRLDRLLHFQKHSLEDYYEQMRKQMNPVLRLLTGIFKSSVIKNLLKRSDPYKAYINKNIERINHFFIKRKIIFQQ